MTQPPVAAGDHWDHLEHLFAEQYRREFENEENVWRSLPFFSATLAVQVAILVQVAPLVLEVRGLMGWVLGALAAANAPLTAGVLFFLARSIRSVERSYIAGEPKLLAYTAELDAYFAEHGTIDDRAATPQAALRHLLIVQYAQATAENRALNQARARARGRAGSLLLASTAATLLLAGAAVGPQLISGQVATGDAHGSSTRSDPAGVTPGPPAGGRGAAAER